MKITTRKGLWVSDSFTEKFGSKEIKPSKTIPPFKTLDKISYDKDLIKEVGESTLEDVAAFLKNPPKGTKDGNWNIFYVAGCVVDVRWFSARREWSVGSWGLVGVDWFAGDRAFGRNWHSDPQTTSGAILESLTLGKAVEMCKEAGYKVFQEL